MKHAKIDDSMSPASYSPAESEDESRQTKAARYEPRCWTHPLRQRCKETNPIINFRIESPADFYSALVLTERGRPVYYTLVPSTIHDCDKSMLLNDKDCHLGDVFPQIICDIVSAFIEPSHVLQVASKTSYKKIICEIKQHITVLTCDPSKIRESICFMIPAFMERQDLSALEEGEKLTVQVFHNCVKWSSEKSRVVSRAYFEYDPEDVDIPQSYLASNPTRHVASVPLAVLEYVLHRLRCHHIELHCIKDEPKLIIRGGEKTAFKTMDLEYEIALPTTNSEDIRFTCRGEDLYALLLSPSFDRTRSSPRVGESEQPARVGSMNIAVSCHGSNTVLVSYASRTFSVVCYFACNIA